MTINIACIIKVGCVLFTLYDGSLQSSSTALCGTLRDLSGAPSGRNTFCQPPSLVKAWLSWGLGELQPGLPFSELNNMFLGYFDPEKVSQIMKIF